MLIQAYKDLLGFIHIINDAVVGKKVSDDLPASPVSPTVEPTVFYGFSVQ